MKKIALLVTILSLFAGISNAQLSMLTLSGTSYMQDFNSLTSIAPALPTGWHLYTGASSTLLGNRLIDTTTALLGQYYGTPASNTSWTYSSGNFRNVASLDGVTTSAAYIALDTSLTTQNAATNRALGVRQVSPTNSSFPNADSGADFGLLIANTTGLTSFKLSFELQSLDSTSPRTTHWLVQYGFGANPTSFTNVSFTGADSTGGGHFYNDSISVNFGSALDNNSGPVWIRIVTLVYSSHSGNRATTAIDNYHLTWTGAGSLRPNVVSTTPANHATGVSTTSPLKITFDKAISKGTSGNIYVKNENDGTTQTKAVTSSDVTISGDVVTISGLTLAINTNYHVTFDSVAFDTASFNSYGIYDTTAWKFKTMPSAVVGIYKSELPLTIIGNPISTQITLGATFTEAGAYEVSIFDMTGRQVYNHALNAQTGNHIYTIQGLYLNKGMYVIKVNGSAAIGIAKFVIE